MSEEQYQELVTTSVAITDDAALIKDRVTLDIVRSTIGDGNPDTEWSAQKLLDAIGSGSKRTHHKYLKELRKEYAKAKMPQLGQADDVPVMPKDLGDTFWRQAWTMATAKNATYLTQLMLSRDALKVQLETAESDINSLLDSSEIAEERLKKTMADAAANMEIASAEKEIASAEKIRADKAFAAIDELKLLSDEKLADQMRVSEEVCKALSLELEHANQHAKEQLELAKKDAQLMLKGLQEVNSQQAQREFDLRTQIADANKRADESNKRADLLVEKLAGQTLKTSL